MLHPKYLREGSQVQIPELAVYVPKGNPFFKIIGIHSGGMGTCIHLKHNDSKSHYALKGIRPDYMNGKDSIDRFFDELKIWLSASMCSLVAEAIAVVRINETPCVLAEWMWNGDLAHVLKNFNHLQKLEILLRMVRGLSWVHKNLGIIHRDLKPANVLLDQDNLAYIADWGLARPVGNIMSIVRTSLNNRMIDRPDRTQAGNFIGTVTYAAPEQILGDPNIDHRADIYAIGCMMFEFESGVPPFTGETITDIARQHIQKTPPKLGGVFRRTELGIENIIAKCLEKKPVDRYSTYEELEEILLKSARQKGVDLDRCTVKVRYERTELGKGHLKQNIIHDNTPIKNIDGSIGMVEADDIEPFLEEACNLMALSRYSEAEQLLRPYILPELISFTDNWFPTHSIALNYALCLIRINRYADAEDIFLRLTPHKEKPAEFYANYSLNLLKTGKWLEAAEVCKRGLRRFSNDLDIQGNLTIALANIGDLDGAEQSAMMRIKIQRDIHSIEEAAGILQRKADKKRDIDLPEAISSAQIVSDLIKEGLQLKQSHYPLRLKEIQLRRFAQDHEKLIILCQAMIDSDECPVIYRQLAFAEMVETLAEGKYYKNALDLINKIGDNLSERVLSIKMRILARHFMIGKENAKGQRILIPEVRKYYIESETNSTKRNPVIVAELLEWLNEPFRAVEILKNHLSTTPDDWDAIRIMALIHLRMGKDENALYFGELLTQIAPWKAESFDWLSYVAQKINQMDIARQAKQQGDEVFEKENRLFDNFRKYLDR